MRRLRRERGERSSQHLGHPGRLTYQTGSSSVTLSRPQPHSLPETLQWPSCVCAFVCVVVSSTLWLSLSSCVLVLHCPFPLPPPLYEAERFSLHSDQMTTAKSTHCYLGAAPSWTSVQVCVSDKERESEIWCVCVCVFQPARYSSKSG